MKRCLGTLALAMAALLGAQTPLLAQEYPAMGRNLNLIVPFPPGGASDAIGRLLAQKFAEHWGVHVIVENKAGADMLIGMQATANAKRDGYTMGLTTVGFVLNGIVLPKQVVDPAKDFAHIGIVGRSPHAIAVNASSPYRTFKDLEAASKTSGEKLNYGSGSMGFHFAAEMLKSTSGLRGVHVPYKGSAPAVQALLAGETTYIVDTQTAIKPFADGGKLRVLAVTARKRSPMMPSVPDLTEVGVAGDYELEGWWGLVFPEGVSHEIVMKANDTLNKIMDAPDVKKKMADLGMEVVTSTPKGMADLIQRDFERYSRLAREAKLAVQK